MGGGNRELVVEPARDADEDHPVRVKPLHEQRRAGGGGHRPEAAEFEHPGGTQGGGHDRLDHPPLEVRRHEDQGSHVGGIAHVWGSKPAVRRHPVVAAARFLES